MSDLITALDAKTSKSTSVYCLGKQIAALFDVEGTERYERVFGLLARLDVLVHRFHPLQVRVIQGDTFVHVACFARLSLLSFQS